LIEHKPWGITLKSTEIPVSIYVRKWIAKCVGLTLCFSAVSHWVVSSVAINAEMLLLKLAITAVFLTCAILAFHYARRSMSMAFDLDGKRREIRTVLEDSDRTVLAATPFDDIEDIFVAKAGAHYALAYVLKGAKSAEILAEGGYGEMEHLERTIARSLA